MINVSIQNLGFVFDSALVQRLLRLWPIHVDGALKMDHKMCASPRGESIFDVVLVSNFLLNKEIFSFKYATTSALYVQKVIHFDACLRRISII